MPTPGGFPHAWRSATAAACLALAMTAQGARLGPDAPSEVAVEPESVVAIAGMPGTVGAWVRVTYPFSVDCSPPAGCYAKAARSYYLVNCASGAMSLVQRMALDLNGEVAAQSDVDYGAPWFLPAMGSGEYVAMRYLCTFLAPRATVPPA